MIQFINKIKIAIEVNGGVVQSIKSNSKDVEVEIFDYDNDKEGIKEPDKKEFPYTIN
jgi:hypothetical protein